MQKVANGGVTDLEETLGVCVNQHPSLFQRLMSNEFPENDESEDLQKNGEMDNNQENEEMKNNEQEEDKDYIEGFCSRPKIIRTPT